MTFYNKEEIYKEFKDAEIKDSKNKKNKYGNRIKFCKEHKQLKEEHPEYYEGVKINFAKYCHITMVSRIWSGPH